MILRTLGITGSAPGPVSPASTYLVQVSADDVGAGIAAGTVDPACEVRDWNVIIDLGNGGLGMVLRYIDAASIDAVGLSHLHPDHCADLSGLYVHLKYHPVHGSKKTGIPAMLPVYGPAAVAQRVEEVCGISDGESMQGPFDFRPGRDRAEIGPITITPYRVRHTIEAYGLRVTGPSSVAGREGHLVTLAYTGDTDYSPDVVALAQGVDVLLADTAFVEGRDDGYDGVHLTGFRAGQVASQAGVGMLLLTHIPVWNDPAVTLAEARQSFHGHVELAEHDGCYVL